jgi:methionine--tRNA ligase beta chain
MFNFLKKDNKEVEDKKVVENSESNKGDKISFDDFKKVEITIGEIKSAEKVENADRLLRLEVDFGTGTNGENEQRQIVSGIAEYYSDPNELVGKKIPFVTNLEPRKIRGLESNGMIMAAIDRDKNLFSLPEVSSEIPAGTKLS